MARKTEPWGTTTVGKKGNTYLSSTYEGKPVVWYIIEPKNGCECPCHIPFIPQHAEYNCLCNADEVDC